MKKANMSETAPEVFSENPFDPATFRVSQDYTATAGVKKALTVVRVTKPDKTWFVRVNPDPLYHLDAYIFELKDESETYLVHPAMIPDMGDMARRTARV
jgi:hypothetical protein